MPPDKRRAPPVEYGGAPLEFVSLGSGDKSEDTLEAPQKQEHSRRAGFARDIVFAEFGYRHARALDYDAFVDRMPNQAPLWWRAAT